MIIYGSEIAKEIKKEVAEKIGELVRNGLRKPRLAIVLVGEDPASLSYIRGKEKASREVGFDFVLYKEKETIQEEELLKLIDNLNQDETIDGILVQLPLPKHLCEARVIGAIDASKDVDGLSLLNSGHLFKGEDGLFPCTALGVMEILRRSKIKVEGQNVIVIGRSKLVGLPLARMLTSANATVTLAHSYTKDLKTLTKLYDIVIVAIGQPKFLKAEDIKEGAVVIDVGINRLDGHLCGDVDFEKVSKKASAITPVPKGVGPMTIACLMQNTLKAYEMRQK